MPVAPQRRLGQDASRGADAGESWAGVQVEKRSASLASVLSLASLTSVASVAAVGSFHADEDGEHADDRCGGLPLRAARAVIEHPFRVLAVWCVAFIVSAPFAPSLLEAVRASYDPQPGMPSFEAKEALDRHFPGLLDQTTDSVLLSLRPGVDTWDGEPVLMRAADALQEVLGTLGAEFPGTIAATRSWQSSGSGAAAEPASSFVSEDERVYLLQVVWNTAGSKLRHQALLAATRLLSAVESLNRTYAPLGLELAGTGPHALTLAAQSQARKDIGVHSIMFLPLAALAMHLHLWRWKLLVLPVISCIASLVVSFAIVFAVATRWTVDQNVPTLMAFLSTSLCIDWSFFLLARFREEETLRGAPHDVALMTALSRTGTNIALSGMLIVACSMCMMNMPQAISSSAVSGSITVVVALTSCLTLLPACLSGFRKAFVAGTSSPGAAGWEGLVERQSPGGSAEGGSSASVQEEVPPCQNTVWYLWAGLVTQFPCNIVVFVLVCAASAPATWRLRYVIPAVDSALCLPLKDPAVLADARFRKEFAGRLRAEAQIHILVEAGGECVDGIKSDGYFDMTCAIAQTVLSLNKSITPVQVTDLAGIAFYSQPNTAECRCIKWRNHFQSDDEASAAMMGNATPSAHLLLTGETQNAIFIPGNQFVFYHALYNGLWTRCTSVDTRSSLVALRVPWDAITWPGFRFVQDLRRALLSRERASAGAADSCAQVRAWEVSEAGVWFDYVRISVGTLPWTIGLASLVSAPFIAVSFGSLVAPFKLLLTVVLPLAWVYGAAVWCFQDGLLDGWRSASSLHSSGGLYWMVPCSTSMLLLALALDFNIFYFGRVFEFRRAGVSDLEAIRQGLASTGPVITCAGGIFALEFSGLFFSEAALNRQGGFVIVTGILLDTLIVRSCLMPVVLSLGAGWNWWPMGMPPVADDLELASVLGSRMATLQGEEAEELGVAVA